MGRKRISIQGDLFKSYMAKLDELGGTDAMKEGAERALKASKEYVNPQIEKAITRLPAGGKYSRPLTAHTIDKDMSVEWRGLNTEIKVGFDFKKSGMTSIFLMYGTPRMKPVTGLKSAIYGSKTQKKIVEIQCDELNKVVKEIMEG